MSLVSVSAHSCASAIVSVNVSVSHTVADARVPLMFSFAWRQHSAFPLPPFLSTRIIPEACLHANASYDYRGYPRLSLSPSVLFSGL